MKKTIGVTKVNKVEKYNPYISLFQFSTSRWRNDLIVWLGEVP